MTLAARVVPAVHLESEQREAMFALMARHYENVHRDVFDADLAEKDWCILLEDRATGRLAGFSTQVLLDADIETRSARVLFSGDTIVDIEQWGSPALAIAWGKLIFAVLERHPSAELFWYLTSKGFRTYRFLPVYFREFYPRYDAPTPPAMQAVLDAVGRQKYPHRYDAAAGIIRACATSDRLRSGLGDVTAERLRDLHVEFFHQRNRGHAAGDELCCIAPLHADNFSPVACRLIRSERFARQTLA